MLRPFLSFLNFMQKSEPSESNATEAKNQNPVAMTTKELISQKEEKNEDIIMLNDAVTSNVSKNLNDVNTANAVDDEEHDFEMQITKTVMLKNPNQIINIVKMENDKSVGCDDNHTEFVKSVENITFAKAEESEVIVGNQEYEQIADFENNIEEEKTNDSVNNKQEDEEKIVDVAFAGSEIIVLPETDLNSSLASDTSYEDPLAIDETFAACPIQSDKLAILPSTNEWRIVPTTIVSSTVMISPQISKSNLDITFDKDCAEEIRSDGSDSGLGTELSALQTSRLSTGNTLCVIQESDATAPTMSIISSTVQKALVDLSADILKRTPLRSNLKRRLSTSTESLPNNACNKLMEQKKTKRSICFDTVQIFYFTRQQGFSCVPSTGGCTLGMGAQHIMAKKLTILEHLAEIRRAHRLQLQESPRLLSSDDSEESEEDFVSDGSGSDFESENLGFLQPIPPKQRRALLKAAGVRKIDAIEKLECRDIRNSRELCGCLCRDYCDPDTCSCSRDGIECQVDRASFPCGCSRDSCGNVMGRVEFNPARVRTHFIHTMMKLEMENRQLVATKMYPVTAQLNVSAPSLQLQPFVFASKMFLENATTSAAAICDTNYSFISNLESNDKNVTHEEDNHNNQPSPTKPAETSISNVSVVLTPYTDTGTSITPKCTTSDSSAQMVLVPAFQTNTLNVKDCEMESTNCEPTSSKQFVEINCTQSYDTSADCLQSKYNAKDSSGLNQSAQSVELNETLAAIITPSPIVDVPIKPLEENSQLDACNNSTVIPPNDQLDSKSFTSISNVLQDFCTKQNHANSLTVDYVPSAHNTAPI